MKKNVIIFGLVIVSTIAFAQQHATPTERASKHVEKMKTELALDDVQSKAIQAIHEEFSGKQIALRKDSTRSKEDKKKQMRALHQERQDAIGKVLNQEQITKWIAQREAHTKKQHGKRKYRGEHAQRMKEDLKLTDDQAAKMKAINQEFGAKIRAVRSDSTIAREDMRLKAKSMRDEYISKTKSVLSEEQFEQWEARKAAHRRKRF